MITVRTKYWTHPVSGGSRITVFGSEGQRTYGYDHSAYDPHTAAAGVYASEVLGMDATATRVRYTRSRHGYVCALTLTPDAQERLARCKEAHPAGKGLSGAYKTKETNQ